MNINIEEIKKINVNDGDIIIFPQMSIDGWRKLRDILKDHFRNKKFVLVNLPKHNIEGIKVLNIKEEK